MSTSTIDHLETAAPRHVRRLQVLHLFTTLVLAAIIVLGVLDGFNLVPAYGVDTSRATARGGGYELEVEYATVSRPALATPFTIEVRRDGGFDAPIELGITRQYFTIFDENGLVPAPSAETSIGDSVLWEFDPPEGDTLTVYFDARIEPQVQRGTGAQVAVFEDGAPVVAVDIHTTLRP